MAAPRCSSKQGSGESPPPCPYPPNTRTQLGKVSRQAAPYDLVVKKGGGKKPITTQNWRTPRPAPAVADAAALPHRPTCSRHRWAPRLRPTPCRPQSSSARLLPMSLWAASRPRVHGNCRALLHWTSGHEWTDCPLTLSIGQLMKNSTFSLLAQLFWRIL